MSTFAQQDTRHSRSRTGSSGSKSRIGWFALLLAGTTAMLLSSCQAESQPSGNVSSGSARGEAVQLVTDDSAFAPHTLELPAGKEVTIEVINNDDIPHDFTIESIDLSTGLIEAGGVATATFAVPESVTEFVCSIHPNMTGRIERT